MTQETTRQRYARQAIELLTKRHGGEYAVVDLGEGEVQIIGGKGQDLTPEQATTLAQFRAGFTFFGLFGHNV
jgi:hypothetical protein